MDTGAELSAVIDLGAGRAYEALPREKIGLVLISHSHFDHIHGDDFFPQATIYAGQEEAASFTDSSAFLEFNGFYKWEQYMPGIARENISQLSPLPSDVHSTPGFRDFPLSGVFTDKQSFDLGKTIVTAIHLPGHTRCHYGFWFEAEGILFSSDLDLVAAGPWLGSNTADVGDLIQSVQRIKNLQPRIIVTSHRRVQRDNLAHQLDRYIQVVIDREARIYDLLNNPQGIIDLSAHHLVYPHPTRSYELFWERMTIAAHIRHLVEENKVREIAPDVYQQW
jgi:glyoxylase-like metal-dependent hydrolase (beta-lactamase superfamily II)